MAPISGRERERSEAMLTLADGQANPSGDERLAALPVIVRVLGRHGTRLRDIAKPLPIRGRQLPLLGARRQVCRDRLERGGSLRPWEVNFLSELLAFPRLSVKQRYILYEVADWIRVQRREEV